MCGIHIGSELKICHNEFRVTIGVTTILTPRGIASFYNGRVFIEIDVNVALCKST